MATEQFDAVLAETKDSTFPLTVEEMRDYLDRLAAAHAAEVGELRELADGYRVSRNAYEQDAAQLQARAEAAERDARRYRAIRNPPPKGDAMCAWSTTEDGLVSVRGKHDGPLTGESLDAAIDACMGEKDE